MSNNAFLQLHKAQIEILEAWEWYEDQQPGLGDRFKQEVAKKINAIVENPFHFPAKGKYREAHTDVFPYLIIFKFDQNKKMISIVSVFHTSRHPKRKYR
jgi:plasmid stabilization system protein ParE